MKLIHLMSAILIIALSNAVPQKKEITHYTYKGNAAQATAEATADCITTTIRVFISDEAKKMGPGSPQFGKIAYVCITQNDSCTGALFFGQVDVDTTTNSPISINNINKLVTFSLGKTFLELVFCMFTDLPDCNYEYICTTKTISLSIDVTWTQVGTFRKVLSVNSIIEQGSHWSHKVFSAVSDASVTMNLTIDNQDIVPDNFYDCQVFTSSEGEFSFEKAVK